MNTTAMPQARQAIAVVNYLLIVGALIAALFGLRLIVTSLLIGVGIGTLLAPLLRRFQKRFKLPKAVGALVIVLIALLGFGGLGYGLFAMTESQMQTLSDRMPQIVESLQGMADGVKARYPWIGDGAASFNVADTARSVGGKVFEGAWASFSMIGALAFAFIIGLYTAVESESYYVSLLRAFPASLRERAEEYCKAAAKTLRNWFGAQLTDMGIIGTLTAIGLWIVGVDYWLLFGLLTAVLGIIPYVGIAIVVVTASLVTLASDPSRVPWVVGVFVLTQQLEGNVILPLVMSGRASLPAVPLLVFMLIVGTWGGLLGVLMAPPLFALLLLAYQMFYLPRVDGSNAAV